MSKFIFDNGYDVQEGKTSAFVAWLTANEEALRSAMPAGIDYIGTYAVVQSSHRETGQFRSLFGANSYGDMDTFSAAVGSGKLGELMNDMFKHTDQSNAANVSQFTLKSATATTYFGED